MNCIRIFNSKIRLSNLIIKKYNYKRISTINSRLQLDGKDQKDVLKDYVPIYKFPYVKTIATVNKIKIYHFIASAVAIPLSVGLYFLDLIDSEIVTATGVLGVSGTIGFSFFSFVTNKWIGFVYLNKEDTKLKISYVDFWGKRGDAEMPLDDLTPLSEIRSTPLDPLFHTLKRYSTNEQFKLNRTIGVILDDNKFYKVFFK